MANKVYVARETALTFNDTAGATTLALNNQTTLTAQVSDRHDLGAGSTPGLFEWRMTIQMATAGVPGEAIHLYISQSDGTLEDGDIGTTAAALTTLETLKNLHYVGSVIVETNSTSEDFRASGKFEVTSRYFSVVVHNDTADNLKATNDVSSVIVTPIPDEIQ